MIMEDTTNLIIENILKNESEKLSDYDYIRESILKVGGKETDIITNLNSINLILCELLPCNEMNIDIDIIVKNFYIMMKHSKEFYKGITSFYGVPSILYPTRILKEESRKVKEITTKTIELVAKVTEKFAMQKEKEEWLKKYELIQGLTGTLSILIEFKDNKIVFDSIISTTKELIRFANGKKEFNGKIFPAWYIRNDKLNEIQKEFYPNGFVNYSLSHGVTGILSILSILILNGIEVKGQRETIGYLLRELYKFRVNKNDLIYWKGAISHEEYNDTNNDYNFDRPSWCYNTGGIARSIYLAGKALNNQYYIKDSIDSIKSINNLSYDELKFDSITFCHGYSGYMHLLDVMYKETNEISFLIKRNELIDKIIKGYSYDNLWGFNNTIKKGNKIINRELQYLNVHEGLVSILLPLTNTIKESSTQWNKLFLIN